MNIIDLSPSPEPESYSPIASTSKGMPLFLPETEDVIEISDSDDVGPTDRKRRRTEAEQESKILGAQTRRYNDTSPKASTLSPSPSAPCFRPVGVASGADFSPSQPPVFSSHSVSRAPDHTGAEVMGAVGRGVGSVPLAGPSNADQNEYTSADARPLANENVVITAEALTNPQELPSPVDEHEQNISRVCEVVPDVLPEHVSQLLIRNRDAFPNNLVEAVVQMLFEGSYPKTGKGKGKARSHTPTLSGTSELLVDFTSTNRVVKNAATYRSLALAQLREDFPDILDDYTTQAFGRHNKLYVPTFLFLEKERASGNVAVVPDNIVAKKTAGKRKGKGKASSNHTDFLLEHAWLAEKRRAEAEAKDAALAQELEDEESGIECGCCFESYSFSKMIQCPEAHLFCVGCITSYAATRLGEQNYKMPCIYQGGCAALFPDSELRRVLPSKLLELYERTRQQHDVQAAAIEGLEECPFCDFKIVFDQDPDTDKLFRCQNEECGRVSCRRCKAEDHLPKSCKEFEQDRKLEGKHAVEEAMTKALMRNCPKCQKPFIKESGCNKMTCPTCGTISCYVCRKAVAGYDHFARQGAHGISKSEATKCPLWDPLEVRHADEVAAAAKQAQEEYKANNPDAADADLHVDLPEAPRPPPLPRHPHNLHRQLPAFHHALNMPQMMNPLYHQAAMAPLPPPHHQHANLPPHVVPAPIHQQLIPNVQQMLIRRDELLRYNQELLRQQNPMPRAPIRALAPAPAPAPALAVQIPLHPPVMAAPLHHARAVHRNVVAAGPAPPAVKKRKR